VDYDAYVERLWDANPELHKILKNAADLEAARDGLFHYLEIAERKIFAVDNDLHILEKATVREGIRVFKSIIGPVNEFRTGVSALEILWNLAQNKNKDIKTDVSVGFLMEFINLFRSVIGQSNIYLENGKVKKHIPDFFKTGRTRSSSS
jgi:lysine 2,3-aminomutase